MNTLPIGSRAGRHRSTACASPPAMIASVPSAAFFTPPETGASTSGYAELRQVRGQLARAHRRRRAHVDDDGAGGQVTCDAIGAEQHFTNDLAVRKHGDDDAACLCRGLPGSPLARPRKAIRRPACLRWPAAHPTPQLVPGADQSTRHGQAHVAETDEADALRRKESLRITHLGGTIFRWSVTFRVCSAMTFDAARKLSTAAGTPQ